MSNIVTISTISSTIAPVLSLTESQVKSVIDAFVAQLGTEVVAGNVVRVNGLGSFEVKDVAARTARNPQTGDPIAVPASRKVAFRVTKSLKQTVKDTV